MGIRKHKPTSPGRRFVASSDFEEVTKSTPEKSLLGKVKKTGGRNNNGRITTRHIGGGHKRRYRIIDFKRTKDGIPAKVAAIEYDPNRTARIALLHYADGEKRYILAPLRLEVGDTVTSGPGADIRPGNALALREIPTGTIVHNVELQIGRGGQLCRSAGTGAQLMAKEGDYATLRLPRCAWCTSIAVQQSARSATRLTRMKWAARPVAAAGAASARLSVVPQ